MTSCTDCPNSGNKKDELSSLEYFAKEMQMIKRNTIQRKFLRNFLEIKGRVGKRRKWRSQLVFLRHVGRAISLIPAIKQNFLKCCPTVKKFSVTTNLSYGIRRGCHEKVYFLETTKCGKIVGGGGVIFTGNMGCFRVRELTRVNGETVAKKYTFSLSSIQIFVSETLCIGMKIPPCCKILQPQ